MLTHDGNCPNTSPSRRATGSAPLYEDDVRSLVFAPIPLFNLVRGQQQDLNVVRVSALADAVPLLSSLQRNDDSQTYQRGVERADRP